MIMADKAKEISEYYEKFDDSYNNGYKKRELLGDDYVRHVLEGKIWQNCSKGLSCAWETFDLKNVEEESVENIVEEFREYGYNTEYRIEEIEWLNIRYACVSLKWNEIDVNMENEDEIGEVRKREKVIWEETEEEREEIERWARGLMDDVM